MNKLLCLLLCLLLCQATSIDAKKKSITNAKMCSSPDKVVNEIYRDIVPISDSEQQKRNVKNVLSLCDSLIVAMKEDDPVFKALFMKINYNGSYWDGLRVKEATEFDLNIALKMPFKACFSLTTYKQLSSISK